MVDGSGVSQWTEVKMAQKDDGAGYATVKFCRTDFVSEVQNSLSVFACFALCCPAHPPIVFVLFREIRYFKDSTSCSPLNIFQLGKPLLLGVAYSLVGECNGTAGTPSESHIFELSVGECTPRNLTSMKLRKMSLILSPRKLHPVLRAERAEKDRFTTGQKKYFLGCLMNVVLGVVK